MSPANEASAVVNFLVQKCTVTASLSKARQLHARILTSVPSFAKSPFVFNNIISMYARCGSFKDSQHVFDQMPLTNLISFNSLICAYSRSPRHAHLAFRLLATLENEDLRPKASTFTSLLQASSTLGNQLLGSLLHAQCIKCGVLDDVCVHTALVGLYSNCGNLECAKRVFYLMEIKDSMSWDFIIFGCIRNGEVLEGLRIFGSMRKNNAWPNQFTFAIVLNGCSRLVDCRIGQLAHAQLIASGTHIDLRLQNALLDMYCSCGLTDRAYEVFRRIENPDLVSWNTMFAGCADKEDGEEALNLLVQFGRISPAKPDEYTYAAVISATGALPAFEYGKPLHAQTEKAGLHRSAYVGSTLISMYFRNDESRSAEKIFQSISEKDVVLWTDMIAGHCRLGDTESAVKSFTGLLQQGNKIDGFALSSVLSACAELAALRPGEVIHSMAIKTGYDAEMSVCGSLIDMYAKSGELQAAESIFFLVRRLDLRCWNSMLGGYSLHGQANEAFELFDEILRNDLAPDQVTFLSLFAACSHRGFVNEGKLFWDCMNEFGIKPGPKHYSCMVSLLSRAGLLEQAEELITKSPFCDDYLELWRTLLSSCVIKGDLKIGVRAAERILRLDEEDIAAKVLLTNLYAATGRWDGVAEIRRKLRNSMTDKDPGVSWIEVTKNIEVFCSGEQTHPLIDEIKDQLQRLSRNIIQPQVEELA